MSKSPPPMQPELATALAAATAAMRDAGIGTLNERTLHGTLKYWLQPDDTCHEVPLGRLVADIFDGETVTEVQTGSLYPLQRKLDTLLREYPVTVAVPVPREKWICWIDPATGERGEPHRSPKRGTPADLLGELCWVSSFWEPGAYPHPLTLRLLLVDMIEYRLQDGRRGNGGKRGAHRADRLPLCIGGEVFVRTLAEAVSLCPPLPDTFTRRDLAKAIGHRGILLSRALRLLEQSGAVRRVGKQGNTILFQKSGNFIYKE